jgi:hypothetical protein
LIDLILHQVEKCDRSNVVANKLRQIIKEDEKESIAELHEIRNEDEIKIENRIRMKCNKDEKQ